MTPRYTGKICTWIDDENFGEIQPDGHHAPLVVYREGLRQAGIACRRSEPP